MIGFFMISWMMTALMHSRQTTLQLLCFANAVSCVYTMTERHKLGKTNLVTLVTTR